MWFVACHIEKEKKRKQTRHQVSSHNNELTWELKERKKEKKKENDISDVFGVIFKERKLKVKNK